MEEKQEKRQLLKRVATTGLRPRSILSKNNQKLHYLRNAVVTVILVTENSPSLMFPSTEYYQRETSNIDGG